MSIPENRENRQGTGGRGRGRIPGRGGRGGRGGRSGGRFADANPNDSGDEDELRQQQRQNDTVDREFSTGDFDDLDSNGNPIHPDPVPAEDGAHVVLPMNALGNEAYLINGKEFDPGHFDGHRTLDRFKDYTPTQLVKFFGD